MLFAAFWLFIGLILGWFFLPTPKWAKTLITAVVARVPIVGKFLKE